MIVTLDCLQLYLFNLTTCSTTQSHCPTFLFFYFISLFFKILMCRSSAEFWGWFLLKGNSRNTFDIFVSTKVLFCKFLFRDFGCFWGCNQAASPHICASDSMITLPLNIYFFLQIYYHYYILKFELFISLSLKEDVHKSFDIKHQSFASNNSEFRQCIFWLPNVL